MTFADWKDGGIAISDGLNELWGTPSDVEELIDRIRQLLDEHPEE